MPIGFERVYRELALTWLLNIGDPTRPFDGYYIKWHTGDPGVAGTTSPSTSLPDRDLIPPGTPGNTWAVGTAGDGIVENSTAGESAEVGAGLGGDTISHFSVWTAVTAGTFAFSGVLGTVGSPAPQTVADGSKLTYQPGDLTVVIDGAE